jgi:uncharacterized repeat protein (TIGR02543 family)
LSITLPPAPTRTGYNFSGRYTAASGGTKAGTGGEFYTPSQTMTLYAQWTAKTYTITLNKDGGTGGSSTVTGTYGSAMPSVTVPTKTGYTFGGYYTSTNGGGTQYYTST